MEGMRAARIAKLYGDILYGKVKISPYNSNMFLEALLAQDEVVSCIFKLNSSPKGKDALQNAMFYSPEDVTFLNGHASPVILYLKKDPDLANVDGGQLLRNILLKIVDPAVFWDRFREAFVQDTLNLAAQVAFAWLLLQLVSLPADSSATYRNHAEFSQIHARILSSPDNELRTLGYKISAAIEVYNAASSSDAAVVGTAHAAPGGRHDNDFADFRRISIVPTPDEVLSSDPVFLRPSDFLQDPRTASTRTATHIDNQFRLFREDLLYELKEELRLVFENKGRGSRSTKITGLNAIGLSFQELNQGRQSRRTKCCIQLQSTKDLDIFKGVKPDNRLKHITDDRNFLKHQSLACLLAQNKIVAFVTINRDLNLLAKDKPIIVVQLEGREGLKQTFRNIKAFKNLTLLQINTALFAYEFVLKALQQARSLPLSEELLLYEHGNPPSKLDISQQPIPVIRSLCSDPSCDLKAILGTKKSTNLDPSQARSLIAGLTQRVSLIQGPPGTGKSYLGALMAKAIHDHTDRRILVVCFTNHALDDILSSLLKVGIPDSSMVRLGGKSTTATESLALRKQSDQGHKKDWESVDGVKMMLDRLDTLLSEAFDEYMAKGITERDILEHLQFFDGDFYAAFVVPKQQDGMQFVGRNGSTIQDTYLFRRWCRGEGPGIFFDDENVQLAYEVWEMEPPERNVKYREWYEAIDTERVHTLYETLIAYNDKHAKLEQLHASRDISILRGKRVIGCTTSAAAKFGFVLQGAAPDVVLVEEAGEILESHILTALSPKLSQLILIGDHKQLRPKVNNYALTIEKGNGFDLNRSLFERLILSGYPYLALTKQHRMRPEISDLIRQLTYPELLDAAGTKGRPDIKGLQDNIVFINHAKPEEAHTQLADRRDMGSTGSKVNLFEVEMVLKIVRYLAQQGYGTDNLVILTPYLGQLLRLRDALKKDNDPVLNDLDSAELVRAGLLSPVVANEVKKPIRLATIDNYQGEESDIVVISMTRSNSDNDIGFMQSPERLNVLLSRARDGMIMIGNSETFKNARRGKELYSKLFALLAEGKHLYEGLPVFCERHPNRKEVLCQAQDFDEKCPDGGCSEPCGETLNCKVHKCPSKCHNIADHSKVQCDESIKEKCPQGHVVTRKCYQTPNPSCRTCDRDAKKARDKALAESKEKERKEAAERIHLRELAAIEAEIEREQTAKREAKEKEKRDHIIRQKRADLAAIKAQVDLTVGSMSAPQMEPEKKEPLHSHTQQDASTPSVPSGVHPTPKTSTNTSQAQNRPSAPPPPASVQFNKKLPSPAVAEWQRQKSLEGAFSPSIDDIMAMVGLEEVKKQVLAIKAKIDTCKRQNSSLAKERFNISFLGNPGTGKTTIARHYSTFLSSVGVIPGKEFIETTGSKLGYEGVQGAEKMLKAVLAAGGGSIFIDEAYQLTNGNNPSGAQVLDFLLAEMENNVGKIVFILAGYNKEMETFFEHNPGLPSRVPYMLKFEDYKDEELMEMFENLVISTFKYRMQVEDGYRGLYSRVAIRRLGRRREASGFGNARDLQVFFAQVRERQAIRLNEERRDGKQPDDFFLAREDLIGPDPSIAVTKSTAWKKLQDMIGLKSVKDSVSNIVDSIQENYQRELDELKPLAFSLNRVFLGSPGTGKTTIAKLYGEILADLGLLSKGEVVVKNPSDFTGAVLGESEKNTKGILNNSVGKVLVIDEAYMLYGGGGDDAKNQSNQFKTSVIDTIVAEVQNVPGDDRCVLLLGYEKQMLDMFNNVNPGLARRFKVEEAFKFEDFNDAELLQILEKKMKEADLGATDPAKKVAIELLSRARNRPNFGNGGEVENLLSKAKEQCMSRRMKMPLQQRPKFIIFEPEDFDKECNRGTNASANLVKLFEDIVGHENIIKLLGGYQVVAQTCKEMGRDPRDRVPTNFVFTGPPGTGKTTIARKMGSVYYDMGILSSNEVIECSATDLVGQYVGQTGPKTQKLFEKALGKVLFVDEAYRLGSGHFAQEAVDELVGLLTHETYKGKIIVILAGYDQEMKQLMQVNTGLSSRFPEWIPFSNMAPKDCINIIIKELKKEKVEVQELLDERSPVYADMVTIIESLIDLPDWGNARDMITLSGQIVNHALLSKKMAGTTLAVGGDEAIKCAQKLLQQRISRAQVQPKIRASSAGLPQMHSTATPPPPPSIGVGTSTAQAKPPPPPGPPESKAQRQSPPPARGRGRGSGPRQQVRQPRLPQAPASPSPAPSAGSSSDGHQVAVPSRDPGVSDQVWTDLQAAKRRAEEEAQGEKEKLHELKARLAEAARKEENQRRLAQQMARQIAKAQDEARRAQLEQQRRAAEEKERRLKAKRDRIAQLQLDAQRAQEERRREEEAVQQKLRQMGLCVAGFQWIAQGNGYRCGGGSHFVTSQQLGM